MNIRFKISNEEWHSFVPNDENHSVWQLFVQNKNMTAVTLDCGGIRIYFERVLK